MPAPRAVPISTSTPRLRTAKQPDYACCPPQRTTIHPHLRKCSATRDWAQRPHRLEVGLKGRQLLINRRNIVLPEKIPVLSVFTGSHSEYHSPRDTPDLLNYEGMDITKFLGLVAQELAVTNEEPDYLEPQKPQEQSARAGLRPI